MSNRRSGDLVSEIGGYWDERAESYSNGVRGELADGRHAAWKIVLERSAAGCVAESYLANRPIRALDLGCGPGFFSIILAELGFAVDAVDASEEMLGRARANVAAAACDSSVTFHEGDVGRLPFNDNVFDIVTCRNLTWLMLDPEAAYAEWLRVLRPGGKLVVFDANWYYYLVDTATDAQRRADQALGVLEGWDEDARATTAEEKRCEEIAAQLPLTPVVRPVWDLEALLRLGARRVRADEDIWGELWTESERAFYASSPLFLVEAVK